MRDAAKTSERILEATENLLVAEGFVALGINRIAAEAGVGKPLIYRYYGGLDGIRRALVDRHLKSEFIDTNPSTDLRSLLAAGRQLSDQPVARALLVWDLADPVHEEEQSAIPVNDLGISQEQAIQAILKAAIRYLVLYRDQHDQWAGLPLESPKDMVRLENAIAAILEPERG